MVLVAGTGSVIATYRPTGRCKRKGDTGYGSERECEARDRSCRDPHRVCDAFSERSLFATSFGLAANGESVQPEELENYRYDNDDTDNIKDVVTHVL